jgi:ParB-like nuclease domain
MLTDAPQGAGPVALADRIELWPIDRLRPYERNPRIHSEAQVDQIAASMVEFGWTNPVLVDEQGGILAGHGRLLAARKLGLAEVPVIRFEHLSEAQKRAYLIADNQLALQAGWDDALLAEELAWLRDERFDLDLVGFDATELERLLAIADGAVKGVPGRSADPHRRQQRGGPALDARSLPVPRRGRRLPRRRRGRGRSDPAGGAALGDVPAAQDPAGLDTEVQELVADPARVRGQRPAPVLRAVPAVR